MRMVSTRITQLGSAKAPMAASAVSPHGGQCRQPRGHAEADIGADHENITVGEIEQHQDTVDHRIPQGDQGIKTAPLQCIDQILEK